MGATAPWVTEAMGTATTWEAGVMVMARRRRATKPTAEPKVSIVMRGRLLKGVEAEGMKVLRSSKSSAIQRWRRSEKWEEGW